MGEYKYSSNHASWRLSGQLHTPAPLLLGKQSPAPNEQPVNKLRRREKFLVPAENAATYSSAVSP